VAGTSLPKAPPNTSGRPTTISDEPLDFLRQACLDPLPHPDTDALLGSGETTLQWLVREFQTLEQRRVGTTASAAEMAARLSESAPEAGQGFPAAWDAFVESVAPYGFRIDHPRFLAFVPTAPTFVSILGELLCAGTNYFAGVWLEAAGPSQVERVVLDWFKEWLGLPSSADGLLTGGGSEANLTALVAARHRLPFEDRARAVVYLTAQRHGSVDRAAMVIGLRPEQLRAVATDHRLRMVPAALEDAAAVDRAAGLLPWLVVANAGATNTGAVDPLDDLATTCQASRLWLHADAAYGWAAVLSPEGRDDLRGIGRCDSITLDPHKWFGQTYDAGCLLMREGGLLRDTFASRADYLHDVAPQADEVNFADLGLALTRRFRALKIWLSVKTLGVGWFRALVEHGYRLAKLAEAMLRRLPQFEVLSTRQLSIVCFRVRPEAFGRSEGEADAFNLAVMEALRESGKAFLSSTRLDGRVALRFCFTNWRTTATDVEAVIGLLTDLANESKKDGREAPLDRPPAGCS
jgi:aromatic-L-amino-acid decarboxylase